MKIRSVKAIRSARFIVRGVFTAVFLSVIAAGCARKDDGRVVITYQTMETLPKQRKLLEELVAKFEAANPGIKVKVQTSTTGFQKLHAQFAGGNVPDVFYYVSDRLFNFVRKKGILDLRPFIEKEKDIDFAGYFPETVEACRLDGGIYLMPVHFSTDVLFYNKDIFDRHGEPYPAEDWTWEKFREVAGKLTLKKGGMTLQYGTLQPRPTLVLRSFGADLFDAGLTKSEIDSGYSRAALSYIKSLSDTGVVPSQAQIRDIEIMDGVTLFSTGKVAMLLGRTYMLVEFGEINAFDWDVTLVPRGARRFSRLAVGGNCISAATAHPAEAWKLVKFLSSEEALTTAAKSRNCVPAMETVARAEGFLHAPPKNVSIFIDSIKDSAMENPGISNWFEYVDKVIQPDVEKVIYNQMSVDEAVADIKSGGEEILTREKNGN